jgi:hypothetical protein
MITIRQCAKSAGLNIDELIVGVAPTARHYALLNSYLLNMHRGAASVRRMMICDMRGYLDIGAHRCAADLLVVLRLFLSRRRTAAPRKALNRTAVGLDRARSSQSRSPPPPMQREPASTSLSAAIQ